MPRSATQLHVPQPCAESWAAMTPTGAGRHCAACQKTVVDFTQKTDAEIMAYLAGAAGQPCGRFRTAQLGRPLQPPPSVSRWRTWLSALLAVGSSSALLVPKATAQPALRGTAGPLPIATTTFQESAPTLGDKPATTASPADSELATSQPAHSQFSNSNLTEIRGIVQDAQCVSLPGATVLVKGTTMGTSTDMKGEFKLALPPTGQSVHLVISFVGYTTQERTVTPALATPQVEVVLEEEVMGLLVIPYHPPLPWHPRAFFNWSKYWLTRPFRH